MECSQVVVCKEEGNSWWDLVVEEALDELVEIAEVGPAGLLGWGSRISGGSGEFWDALEKGIVSEGISAVTVQPIGLASTQAPKGLQYNVVSYCW